MPVDFEGLVRSQGRMYYGWALRQLGSREDAEEAVSDAFMAIYRVWPKVLRSRNPLALAFKILRDTVCDRRRVLLRRPVSVVMDEDHADADDAFAGSDARIDLQEAIAKLYRTSPRQAECVVLHYFLGDSYEEISAKLGITVAAAKTSAHLGKRRLCHGNHHDTRPKSKGQAEGENR
ncbi:RNA polymerase sigma factor [Streptomyces milbemycinicus]|uniref:RNA polymerase sigma factor n=1 Tax=Streptomyces milbemycinicus TaxID=476552 RepID=UPI0033F9FA4D